MSYPEDLESAASAIFRELLVERFPELVAGLSTGEPLAEYATFAYLERNKDSEELAKQITKKTFTKYARVLSVAHFNELLHLFVRWYERQLRNPVTGLCNVETAIQYEIGEFRDGISRGLSRDDAGLAFYHGDNYPGKRGNDIHYFCTDFEKYMAIPATIGAWFELIYRINARFDNEAADEMQGADVSQLDPDIQRRLAAVGFTRVSVIQ